MPFRRVDYPPLQPVDQGRRGQIHHGDLIGLLQDPIGQGFPYLDSRNLQHLIVEAFQMLDIHRSDHVDAGIQKDENVLPTFRSLGAGDVGVGNSSTRQISGFRARIARCPSLQRQRPAVFDLAAGHQFQAFRLCDGVLRPCGSK